jgi:hypothetical protein
MGTTSPMNTPNPKLLSTTFELEDPLYDKYMEAYKKRTEQYTGDFLLDVFYQHFTKGKHSKLNNDEKKSLVYGLLISGGARSPQQ